MSSLREKIKGMVSADENVEEVSAKFSLSLIEPFLDNMGHLLVQISMLCEPTFDDTLLAPE